MTKKEKRKISSVFAIFYLLMSLFIYWIVFESTNIYIFLAIIVTTALIEKIIFLLLPDKKKVSHSPVSKKTSNRLRKDRDIIVSQIEELSWREFERLCYLYFKAKRYNPRETKEGADGGVDLIIYNRQHQSDEAIQIKHYQGSGKQISVKEIRELNSAKRNHKCVLAKFITTSTFSNTALREADQFKIECYDMNWVRSNIVKWQEVERGKVG